MTISPDFYSLLNAVENLNSELSELKNNIDGILKKNTQENTKVDNGISKDIIFEVLFDSLFIKTDSCCFVTAQDSRNHLMHQIRNHSKLKLLVQKYKQVESDFSKFATEFNDYIKNLDGVSYEYKGRGIKKFYGIAKIFMDDPLPNKITDKIETIINFNK